LTDNQDIRICKENTNIIQRKGLKMALIKLGTIVTDIRGAIGGVIFSRNKSGAIARQRTTPVNPRTPLQNAIRALVASISQAWRASTSTVQKAAWAVFGSNVDAKNKLGEVIKLSGFNQFMKSNLAAQNAGLPQILDAPIVFTLPGEDPTLATVVSEAAQTIAVTFDDALPWVDEDDAALLVYMGLPQDDSIGFFNGPWRYAGALLGDGVTPPVTGDPVPCPFVCAAGQKIFTKAKIIRADGRVSDDFRTNAIAGA
jgi:hypothetical protein